MQPQILALGLKLSLTKFACSVLSHFRVSPSQLLGVAWCTVLEFEALCTVSAPNACQHKVFCASYALRKTSKDVRFFLLEWVRKAYCEYGRQRPWYTQYRGPGVRPLGSRVGGVRAIPTA